MPRCSGEPRGAEDHQGGAGGLAGPRLLPLGRLVLAQQPGAGLGGDQPRGVQTAGLAQHAVQALDIQYLFLSSLTF